MVIQFAYSKLHYHIGKKVNYFIITVQPQLIMPLEMWRSNTNNVNGIKKTDEAEHIIIFSN